MLFLFAEFITEFESTWTIIQKQLFAEGKGKINEFCSRHLIQISVNFYSLLCHFLVNETHQICLGSTL